MKKQKLLKSASILAVLVLSVLALTSCVSAPPIEATWALSSISGSGDMSMELANFLSNAKAAGFEIDMTFSGGKGSISSPGFAPQTFTYTLNGSKITMVIDGLSSVCTWTVSGNTLTLDYSGSHLVLAKKN